MIWSRVEFERIDIAMCLGVPAPDSSHVTRHKVQSTLHGNEYFLPRDR